MTGAVFAFVLTILMATGRIRTRSVPEQNPPAIRRSFHFVSVGLAIWTAKLIAHIAQPFKRRG